ncbi:YegS/Rv2252/BmrU family lipid kinase [candidate division KSB1 bacterium]|nr:YegS/Rv2252/BmrU family lipid kinase [candidate division KSB1 bacterium]
MKLLLVTNPAAGKGRGLKVSEQAAQFLKSHDIETQMLISNYAGHIADLMRDVYVDNYNGIVAVGGDGTLFEIINGLLKTHSELSVPLGQIPVGTGNSFIRDLGILTLQDAYDKILAQKTRPVDVGYFTYDDGEYYFINLLGFGFVANVAHRARKYKMFGDFSYIFGVLEEVVILSFSNLEITIDGTTYHRQNTFVEISNSTCTGGDMIMAPDAKIDDGYLDVILLRNVTRIKLLKAFPKIFKGTHVEMDEVEVFKAKHIIAKTDNPKILTPDGEVFGSTPIEVKILPHKIRMFG